MEPTTKMQPTTLCVPPRRSTWTESKRGSIFLFLCTHPRSRGAAFSQRPREKRVRAGGTYFLVSSGWATTCSGMPGKECAVLGLTGTLLGRLGDGAAEVEAEEESARLALSASPTRCSGMPGKAGEAAFGGDASRSFLGSSPSSC